MRKSRSPLRGGGQDNRSHGDDQSYDLGDEEDPIGPVAAEMKGHGALLRRSGLQVSTAGGCCHAAIRLLLLGEDRQF